MHGILPLVTTITVTSSPDNHLATMTSLTSPTSTQRPQSFISRPHLQIHGISNTGFEKWETRITFLEFYVLLLSITVMILFLAWLALLGLDYLRPRYRGQARLSEKVLRYLKLKTERLKDKDEDDDTAVDLGEGDNNSERSAAGLKEDSDTEKGELTGERLGLNEPRRRN